MNGMSAVIFLPSLGFLSADDHILVTGTVERDLTVSYGYEVDSHAQIDIFHRTLFSAARHSRLLRKRQGRLRRDARDAPLLGRRSDG